MRNRPPTGPRSDARFGADRRGVSTALGYVITLGITAVLVSGLLVAGGSLVKSEREVVASDQLEIAGEQLATGLADADRLASTGGDGTVRVELWLPSEAGGSDYALRIEQVGGGGSQPHETRLVADASTLGVSQSVTIRTNAEVADATVQGGPVVVSYVDADGDGDRELLVEDADQASDPNLGGGLALATVDVQATSAILDSPAVWTITHTRPVADGPADPTTNGDTT